MSILFLLIVFMSHKHLAKLIPDFYIASFYLLLSVVVYIHFSPLSSFCNNRNFVFFRYTYLNLALRLYQNLEKLV